MDALGVIFAAVVVLIAGLAILRLAARSAAGTLAPNGLAGVRTVHTLRSERAWYAAQSAAADATGLGGWGAVAGGLIGGLSATLALTEVLPAVFVPVGLVATIAGALWLLVWILIATVRGSRAGVVAADAERVERERG